MTIPLDAAVATHVSDQNTDTGLCPPRRRVFFAGETKMNYQRILMIAIVGVAMASPQVCATTPSVPASMFFPAWKVVPPERREEYRHLYQEAVVQDPDDPTTRRFHRARLEKRHGIWVLRLRGDRFEMAFQHGRLLQGEILSGRSLDQASRLVANAIRNNLGEGLAAAAVEKYVDTYVINSILSYSQANSVRPNQRYLDDAYGLAEATGLSVETIVKAAFAPEASQVLLGLTTSNPVAGSPGQCSSFVARGRATSSGDLIIGRNTDYPLVGHYDVHPTVIYFEPTDGDLRYMAITSAGFHNAGVAGMNESGIYVSVHTIPTTHVSAEGMPAIMMGQEILRTARSIRDVEAIFQRAHPAAGWTYLVVSTRENVAKAYEIAANGTGVVETDQDTFVVTNHWRSDAMRPKYLHINQSVDEDTLARMTRVTSLLQDHFGSIDPSVAMEVLGDKFDPINNVSRNFPNTVAVHTTVSSTVWVPNAGKVYVASGQAPVSRTIYVEFPTITALHEDSLGDIRVIEPDPSDSTSELVAAERHFILGKMDFEYRNDPAAAAVRLRHALGFDPENPALRFVYAVLLYKSDQTADALRELGLVIPGYDVQRSLLARYLRGRILGSQGARDAALEDLKAVVASSRADVRLKKASSDALARIQKRGRAPYGPKEFRLMMQQADAFGLAGGVLAP